MATEVSRTTTSAEPESTTVPPDRRRLGLLASGHLVVDMTVGMLSPLLPAFKKALSLSDLRTSLLLASITFSSSFIQPLFGVLADRVTATWMLLWGAGLATACLAAAGLVSNYWVLLMLIVVCGLGVGAYHPEAARLANHFAGTRKATGVAYFTVGGNIGFAFGPLVVAAFVPLMDQRATLLILVPGIIACTLLALSYRRIAVPVTPYRRGEARYGSDVRGMTILVTCVSLRTWTQFGLMAIAPVFLTGERGMTDRQQGFVIFAFVITGAVGTMAGAAIADAIGGRLMLLLTLPLVTPCIVGFILDDGALGIISLSIAGFILMASFSATVVMGQNFMPDRLALAAAWVLGFGAIGAATPWLPAVGAIADQWGRETALWIIAALPIVAALVAAAIPSAPRYRIAMVRTPTR